MQDHDAKRHPGPWRVMQLDSEFAGWLVAVGFLVMGLVSMPLATGFVLGAIALGVVVALLLRFTPGKLRRTVVGTAIILAAFALWWVGHKPRRPHTVSPNALYVLPNNVPFRLHTRLVIGWNVGSTSMRMLIDANFQMKTETVRLRMSSSHA
jgi:hypothetical protein